MPGIVESGGPGGDMERFSLRFLDPRLEERFQNTGGREGRNGFMFAAGTSAVLWPVAGWLLPQGTVLLADLAWPVALTMSAISALCVLAARWAVTMDRQHGLLSLLTSANGLVILGLAAVADFLPGYAVSAIMVLFAYGFVSRTRFIFAALRTAVIGVGFFYVVATYTGPANLAIDVFYFAAMGVGTLLALRLLERGRRSLFHQQLVVAEQARELELENISAQTWAHVRKDFACELRGQTELRGKGDVETYLVVGRRASPHSMPADPESVAAT